MVRRRHRRIRIGGSQPDVHVLLEVLPLPGIRNDGSLAQLDLEIELIMNQPIRRAYRRLPTPRAQRGTMLIIALIVLVAMTLAGIATMRSVDTATLMAGNIAFRQSALNAADQGVQAGFAQLQGKTTSTLSNDGAFAGYVSNSPAVEPDWTNDNSWAGSAKVNGGAPDAAGNVVEFVIHRLCTLANAAPTATNNRCGSTVSTAKLSREGEDNFRLSGQEFSSQLQVQYRITARAVGPRRSIAIVQMLTY
jgi:Tfp pilus assembly protein PilX